MALVSRPFSSSSTWEAMLLHVIHKDELYFINENWKSLANNTTSSQALKLRLYRNSAHPKWWETPPFPAPLLVYTFSPPENIIASFWSTFFIHYYFSSFHFLSNFFFYHSTALSLHSLSFHFLHNCFPLLNNFVALLQTGAKFEFWPEAQCWYEGWQKWHPCQEYFWSHLELSWISQTLKTRYQYQYRVFFFFSDHIPQKSYDYIFAH